MHLILSYIIIYYSILSFILFSGGDHKTTPNMFKVHGDVHTKPITCEYYTIDLLFLHFLCCLLHNSTFRYGLNTNYNILAQIYVVCLFLLIFVVFCNIL